MIKRIAIITAVLLLAGIGIAHAASLERPKLIGYICVDPKGIHHKATDVFESYCMLIPNPASRR